jgi:FkbM family methyltransferase
LKPRDLINILGIKPKPVKYGFEVISFELAHEGRIEYAQWLHPAESKKKISQSEVDELRKFISPGNAAIDIGAHSGDSTIPMALAAGRNGCVLAWEPNPYVFPVLEKNASLNRDKTNIVPLMFAATSEPGEYEFEYSDSGFCNGGWHEGISQWRHGHSFKLKVRGENLEWYLEKHYPDLIPKIRFIKVDAEGYDYQILHSLDNLINKQRPFVKCEIYKHLNFEKRARLFDLLSGWNYDIFKIESESNYMGEKVTKENLTKWRHYDVFCLPIKHN